MEREDSIVSCITFSHVANIAFEGKVPSPSLCTKLKFPGGTTSYCNALKSIMDVIDKSTEDRRFVVVLMSDGQPDKYPTDELNKLKHSYEDRIQHFWTVGFGQENILALDKMAKYMCATGTYKRSTDEFKLLDIFVEIASSKYELDWRDEKSVSSESSFPDLSYDIYYDLDDFS